MLDVDLTLINECFSGSGLPLNEPRPEKKLDSSDLLYHRWPCFLQDTITAYAFDLGKLGKLISANSRPASDAFVDYAAEDFRIRGFNGGSTLGAHGNSQILSKR
jgi:hypothetical protein